MTPSINVNLAYNPRDPHADEARVLIPCRLPPSFTCNVSLGECTCVSRHKGRSNYGPRNAARLLAGICGMHKDDCPARLVRVSCSISGKTWEDSDVVECEVREGTPIDARNALYAACRARWALVKALVLGAAKVAEFPEPFRMVPAVSEMMVRRDAVFAALADMARHEDGVEVALTKANGQFANRDAGNEWVLRPSERTLARYVEHLVEQVGILS